MTQQLVVTPASQWRQVQGQPYRLPGCGMVALLRRVSPLALAARVGAVPNALANQVLRFEAVRHDPKSEADHIKHHQQWAESLVELAKLCFVEPRIVTDREPNYDAGEIAPTDLTDLDYYWLSGTFIKGSASDRDAFRVDVIEARERAKAAAELRADFARIGVTGIDIPEPERVAAGVENVEGVEVG